jgi:hypothetical protein
VRLLTFFTVAGLSLVGSSTTPAEDGAAASGRGRQQASGIFAVVGSGDLERARTLLAEDPTLVSSTDSAGRTPLFAAVAARNVEMARLLIERGADIDVQCNSLTTQLYFAVLNGNLEYVTGSSACRPGHSHPPGSAGDTTPRGHGRA